MLLDLLYLSASVAFVVFSITLITVFVMLTRILTSLNCLLKGLRLDVAPMASDLRVVTQNLASASGSLRTGLQRVEHMTVALENFGDDLALGRNAVKGTWQILVSPWLAKLKNIKKK
jgi:hypothetical protein